MSVNYADGLSPYDNKGKCGMPEVLGCLFWHQNNVNRLASGLVKFRLKRQPVGAKPFRPDLFISLFCLEKISLACLLFCTGRIFGEDSSDDDHDYDAIMNNALTYSNQEIEADGNRIALDKITVAQFNHLWQANNFVCHWVKTHSASALIVTEDFCTKCFDVTSTLVQGTYPIFSIDHGSLGSRVFNMYPSPEDINEMFFDVISYYKWKEFFVLFDTHMVYRNLQPFLNKASDQKWNLQFIDVDDEPTKSWTQLIREGNFRNILIYCSTEDVLVNTLMNAIDNGLMETDYHWIIGNPDVYYNETHIENLLDVDAYITNFRMTVDPSAAYSTYNLEYHGEWKLRQKLIFDTVFVLSRAVMSYSAEMKRRNSESSLPGDTIMPRCEEKWTAMPQNPLTSHIIKNLQLQGLSGNIAFNEMGNRVNYSISIYSGKGGSMDSMRGEWIQNRQHWEELYNDELAPDVVHLSIDPMWNAGDEVFIVGSVMVSPFMMQIESDDDDDEDYLEGNAQYEGYIPDLMEKMSEVLFEEGIAFEYELEPNHNGYSAYGYKNLESEEWSGVIGDVINQRIDVAAGPITITDKREDAVDFTVPFGHSPIQLLVKHPSYIYNTRDFSFTFPLGTEVWCANLVAMFLVAALLSAINRASPTEWAQAAQTGKVSPNNEDNFNFKNSLWFLTSSTFLQSYDASPRSHAGRLGAAVWWVFSLLMLTSYFINLSDYMHVNKQHVFYRTSRDLLQQTDIVYGCVKEGSTYSMMENAQFGDLRSMHEYMFTSVSDPYVSDISSGVERVRMGNGKYAFMAETALMLNEMTEAPCDIYLVPEAVGTARYGLAVQPGSPLRDQLSHGLKILKERKVLEDLEAKWFYPESECEEKFVTWNTQGLYSLTIVDLKGVYYMLLIGIAIALLFFFLELMFYMLLRSPRRFLPIRERPVSNGTYLQRNKDDSESNVSVRNVSPETSDGIPSGSKKKQWL